MMTLNHLSPTVSPEEVVAALRADGACIIDDVLDASSVATLQAELAAPLASTAEGADEFSGWNTRRFGALIERCPATRPLVTHPLILGAARGLLADATAVQLHLTQAICIGPDSPAQVVHRDQWAFDFFAFPVGYEVQCNTIWALSDFTEANGATRVAPGTHLTDGHVDPAMPTIAAEMTCGSVLVYTGAVVHGGGANSTDETRIGVNITYNRGWLRQEENQYLAVSRECAAHLDEDLLRLMGYGKGAYALGYIDDLRDPIGVVRPDLVPGAAARTFAP